jgi:SSS family solute:Na+ symporter
MGGEVKTTALAVFVAFFGLVTILGFVAARWRGGDLDQLHEWGLAGRRFGTIVSWFLVGGDFYTAYTVIAVPALVWGVGAAGFFALPYTIMVYPIVYLLMPRLWQVARRHGYVTAADFVRGRYGNRWLALAVALTGILATMPYIALQLVGMQVVLAALGLGGSGVRGEVPLVIAFAVLALYTYKSGLRAPALIALVKDLMIFIVIIAAVVAIPAMLGGYGAVFDAAAKGLALRPKPGHLILPAAGASAYASLALGSAMAAFMYPHTVTAILSSSSGAVIQRNAALLPAYTFLLGLIALLGYMAIAAGITPAVPSQVVPLLFLKMFPEWFAGFAFAAIAISALVPAAIMSIAAANLFTRNIYREYLDPDVAPAREASIAKLVSLVVKLGALAFILFLPTQFAINLQLLGGVWILQTFPAIAVGLYTARLDPRALLLGWGVGMVSGTAMVASTGLKSAVYVLHLGGFTVSAYAALFALAANLATLLIAGLVPGTRGRGMDETTAADYVA